jgi:hypothetical protein
VFEAGEAAPGDITVGDIAVGGVATGAGSDVRLDRRVDARVEEALRCPLGVETLPLLTAVPFAELSAAGRSAALRRLTEYQACVESLRSELTALIAGPAPSDERGRRDDFSAHDVAVATRCPLGAADRDVAVARDLAARLAASHDAMRRGEISAAQVRVLSDATSHLDPALAQEIERRVLPNAHRQDTSTFRAAVRRWAARLDPDFITRAERARAECVAVHTPCHDGTGELYLRGPLEVTTTVWEALRSCADGSKDQLGGTVDQRIIAAVRDWAESALARPGLPTRHGRPPTVCVTIDLPTLLGLQAHPAEIPGVGLIPPDAARWLLADGAPLRRLVTDPLTGHLLDYGRSTYQVPAALADHLIAHAVRSASPHSGVPAAGCDMEHNQPFERGGRTDPINVTPVARRWHRAKTHAGWSYVKSRDGTVTWSGPTGLTCTVTPHDYRTSAVD